MENHFNYQLNNCVQTMGTLYRKIFLLCLFLIACPLTFLVSQVDFKVDQEEEGIFVVKLVPTVDWESKEAITVTAQVTVVTPVDTDIESVESLNGVWQKSGTFKSPTENEDANYIVFGLTSLATTDIAYNIGKEVPLFSFKRKGACNGTIRLMENEDPFATPNSLNVNVGNQITTFGSGNTNAFGKNIGDAVCQ